jgi:hypothetical protein
MSNGAGTDTVENKLRFERLSYINQQKISLCNRSFSIFGTFHSITTAIVGAAVLIFVGWSPLHVDREMARIGILALILLQFLVLAFSLFSLVAGICAWQGYKTEERDIANALGQPPQGRAPKIWSWFETYMAIFIFIVSVALMLSALAVLLPRI